jgi:hypothetical protein
MASCLVLVNDFLVGNDVDGLRRCLSPASIALRTALMAVRNFERSAELCEFALAAWRARLRACAELAMTVPYPVPVSST